MVIVALHFSYISTSSEKGGIYHTRVLVGIPVDVCGWVFTQIQRHILVLSATVDIVCRLNYVGFLILLVINSCNEGGRTPQASKIIFNHKTKQGQL